MAGGVAPFKRRCGTTGHPRESLEGLFDGVSPGSDQGDLDQLAVHHARQRGWLLLMDLCQRTGQGGRILHLLRSDRELHPLLLGLAEEFLRQLLPFLRRDVRQRLLRRLLKFVD